jgi:hypothetical protein
MSYPLLPVRWWQAPAFRRHLAFSLAATGVLLVTALLVVQALNPKGQFGIDFAAYHAAASAILGGHSPYAAAAMTGPVAAQSAGYYLYPPALAGWLAPLGLLPLGFASVIWLIINGATMLAALLIAGSRGTALTAERVAWTIAAMCFSLPVFSSLWMGNLEGPLALVIALSLLGSTSGLGRGWPLALGASVAAKLTPATIALAVGKRGSARNIGIGVALAVAPSLVLAPSAWFDYPTVLLHLSQGSSAYGNNFAPDNLLAIALDAGRPIDGLRIAVLVGSLGLLVLGWTWGRTHTGAPAAVACGVIAGLLIPATLWFHYFALLLPFAAFAWVRATTRERLALLAGGALLSAGLSWFPFADIGAIVLMAAVLRVLAPPRSSLTMARLRPRSDIVKD